MSHREPKDTKWASRTEMSPAAKLERQQWKEAAPERAAAGTAKQQEDHAARVKRDRERKAAAAKAALSERLKAAAVAEAKSPPVQTLAAHIPELA